MNIIMNVFSTAIIEKYEQRKKRFYPMKMVFYKPIHKVFTSYVLNRHLQKKENFKIVSNVVMKNLELLKVEKKSIQNNLTQHIYKKFLQKLSNNLTMMTFPKTYTMNGSKKNITQIQNNINKQHFLHNFFDFQKSYLSQTILNGQKKFATKIQQNLLINKLKNYQKDIFQNNRVDNQIKKFKNSETIYLQPMQTDQKIYHQRENRFYFNKEQQFEDSFKQIKETIVELKEKVINKELQKQSVEKENKNQDIDINHLTNQVYQNIERKIRFERERKGF